MAAGTIPLPDFWRRLRFGPLWLAVPALVFLVVFFLFPMLRLLVLSIQDTTTHALTPEHYQRLARTPVYWRILGITFQISLFTAFFSVVLGYPVASWLASMDNNRRNRWMFLVLLPFWTSYLVKTFAWMIMLGDRGVINSILTGSGMAEEPLSLMYNMTGVVIGMVHAMMPLAILTMVPVLAGIDRRLSLAAGAMGARRSQRFWLIDFPLSMPGIAAAGLLTFITSLGFFIVPAYLGGRGETMLAQIIIVQVQELVNWAFAAVLSVMLVFAALVAIWIYDRFFGLSTLTSASSSGTKPRGSLLRRIGQRILAALAWLSSPFDRIGGNTGASGGDTGLFRRGYVYVILLFLLAYVGGKPWQGHVPGPDGLPGGYPVRLAGKSLRLDLPAGVREDAAIRWNDAFEHANGLTVSGQRASYHGRLAELLHAAGFAHADGFDLGDLEAVCRDMTAWKEGLLAAR